MLMNQAKLAGNGQRPEGVTIDDTSVLHGAVLRLPLAAAGAIRVENLTFGEVCYGSFRAQARSLGFGYC